MMLKIPTMHVSPRRAEKVCAPVFILCGMLVVWSLAGPSPALAGTPTSCESLTNFSFPDTTINSAQSQPGGAYVAPDAWHLAFTNLPPYCEVQATIKPTPDSSINVRVWMPTARYNGRYLGTGNGGYAGGFFFSELADGINRGFATANTDMGATGAAGVNGDALVGHPGEVEGLRLAFHASDDDVLQGAHQRVLRQSGEPFVLRGLLHRRPAGADGSPAVPQRLRRHPRRCARL